MQKSYHRNSKKVVYNKNTSGERGKELITLIDKYLHYNGGDKDTAIVSTSV